MADDMNMPADGVADDVSTDDMEKKEELGGEAAGEDADATTEEAV
jgi:hypothetical protein